ncbi:MAG: hypothetical protein ACLGJB_26050 [Blastocatellia bacterium]
MTDQNPETALVALGDSLKAAVRNAVGLRASSTTSEGKRRNDLLRDKQNIVSAFFQHINKNPAEVKPVNERAARDSNR